MAIHNLMGFNRQWTAKILPTVSELNCSISQDGNYQLADRAGWNSHMELTTHPLLELIPQSRLKILFNHPMHPMSTIWEISKRALVILFKGLIGCSGMVAGSRGPSGSITFTNMMSWENGKTSSWSGVGIQSLSLMWNAGIDLLSAVIGGNRVYITRRRIHTSKRLENQGSDEKWASLAYSLILPFW